MTRAEIEEDGRILLEWIRDGEHRHWGDTRGLANESLSQLAGSREYTHHVDDVPASVRKGVRSPARAPLRRKPKARDLVRTVRWAIRTCSMVEEEMPQPVREVHARLLSSTEAIDALLRLGGELL